MNYPFKVKLTDQRFQNVDYIITVKDEKDWQRIQELCNQPQYTIEPIVKKTRMKLAEKI